MIRNRTKKRIIGCLKDERVGLSISAVARKVDTDRITATKYLERLEKEGWLEEFDRSGMRIFVTKEGYNG